MVIKYKVVTVNMSELPKPQRLQKDNEFYVISVSRLYLTYNIVTKLLKLILLKGNDLILL